MNRLFGFGLAAMLTLATASAAAGGTTGAMSGRVVDDDGNPLAGAHVKARGPAGTYETVSDHSGHYQILSIYPDRYDVSVWRIGNLNWRAAPLDISADQVTTCNVRLLPYMTIIGRPSREGNSVVPCSFIGKHTR